MNAGAAAARGDVLLFLHADTMLPEDAGTRIHAAVNVPNVLGGNFRLRFDAPGTLARLFAAGYNRRSRRQRIFYGDSALWVRREVFESLGSYREATLMEDYAFCLALRAEARRRHPNLPLTETLPLLPATVVTSARRFHGRRGLALKMLATWTLLHLLYACGASPETLERRFYPPAPPPNNGEPEPLRVGKPTHLPLRERMVGAIPRDCPLCSGSPLLGRGASPIGARGPAPPAASGCACSRRPRSPPRRSRRRDCRRARPSPGRHSSSATIRRRSLSARPPPSR